MGLKMHFVKFALSLYLLCFSGSEALDVHMWNTGKTFPASTATCRGMKVGKCCQAAKPYRKLYDSVYDTYRLTGDAPEDMVSVFRKNAIGDKDGCSGTKVADHEYPFAENDVDRSGSIVRSGTQISGVRYTNCYTARSKMKELASAWQANWRASGGAKARIAAMIGSLRRGPSTGACFNPRTRDDSDDDDGRKKRSVDDKYGLSDIVYPDQITFNGTVYSDDHRGDLKYRDKRGVELNLDLLWEEGLA
ncbi:MAG: hypothetical protein M1833_000501 [Piccolia ochrophora]|nr:MAG: hypothetical protein M1833_000501 [Piccolia ochrophora]